MRLKRLLFLVPSALALAVPAALADGGEVAPFVGLRTGGELFNDATGRKVSVDGAPSFGVTVDLPLFKRGQLEILWSRQVAGVDTLDAADNPLSFDLVVDYIHVGSTHEWGPEDLRRFVFVTLGATYFDGRGAEFDSSLGFSGSLGGGAKFFVSDRVGIRLEARGYGTLTSGSAGAVCGPGCVVGFSGSGWWQLEINAGVIVRF